jgi:hypothetical protein
MKTVVCRTLALVALAGTLAGAQPSPIKTERVAFKAGASQAIVKGAIQGDTTVDYLLGAQAGQTMKVTLKASNRFTYFNVMETGKDEAIFVGSTSGDTFEGLLPVTGDYTVRVYLMRNAARRGEKSDYTVTFSITGKGTAPTPGSNR